ncbi:MAG TPA: tRNA pseudouridine(55) synthase TruB [Rectinemataceae bacterium]|nr:tRNA pseudouridine(55) synthase TruB [Rectinemataceae bacterium]
MTASGFLLFDKPAGRTSFAALGGFRKIFPGTRVGHTGTLDNFATGLLVVVVGSHSHLTPWFTGLDKEYEAEIRFGVGTDTLDPGGAVTATGEIPSLVALEASLGPFRGRIEQIPPEYSAIHVEGKRASDMARKGETVKLQARPITIHSLDLVDFKDDKASMNVRCSSGTYIRSLARDIAAACGTCAHVSALRRTMVGAFSVKDAISSPEEASIQNLHRLDPKTAGILGLDILTIGAEMETSFLNGLPALLAKLDLDSSRDGEAAVFSEGGNFLGVIERLSGRLGYKFVMPRGEILS